MDEGQFAMVSEWMVGGTINQYIKEHRDENRFKLVGFWFLLALFLADLCSSKMLPRGWYICIAEQ